MKKVFFYMAMIVAIAACGGGDDNGGNEPVVVSSDYVSVQPTSIQLPGAETAQELTINANCGWNVSSDVDWISINPSFGSGNSTVTISASLNSTGADRTGTLTIRNEKHTLIKEVRVTQVTPTGAIVPTIDDNHFPEG